MQRAMARSRERTVHLMGRKALRLQPCELENKWEEVNSKGQERARSSRDLKFIPKSMQSEVIEGFQR